LEFARQEKDARNPEPCDDYSGLKTILPAGVADDSMDREGGTERTLSGKDWL
jgi:hypothetical protein